MSTRKTSSTEDSNVEFPLKKLKVKKKSVSPMSVMVNTVMYQVIREIKELL